MSYIKQKGANVVVINAGEDVQGFFDAMPDKDLFELIDGEVPEGFTELNYKPEE